MKPRARIIRGNMTKPTTETPTQKCTYCDSDATVRCQECDEYLCNNCKYEDTCYDDKVQTFRCALEDDLNERVEQYAEELVIDLFENV